MTLATEKQLKRFRLSYGIVQVLCLPAIFVGLVLLVGGLLILKELGIDRRFLLLGFLPGMFWYMLCSVMYFEVHALSALWLAIGPMGARVCASTLLRL